MRLDYRINNQNHSIFFCKKRKFEKISSFLNKIKSDKNVLFIFDSNINKKIVSNIFDELKTTGCKVIKVECVGEKLNKNEKLLFKILDILLENNFTKKSVVISMGGGVIGDVSALASNLYLRGLNYICIPTTMTAIVDSSIGGKTAINYKGVTNSIGTYYHPKCVFVLEEIIKNLPEREYIAGIPEILKCGIIGNSTIVKILNFKKKEILKRDIQIVFRLCYLTLKTKIKFFLNDVFENNKRLNLNFGHTFAHAIEMAIEQKMKKDFIRHGEAVGIGMLCEIFYESTNNEKIYNFVKKILLSFNLPINLSIKKIPLNKTNLHNQIYKNIFLDKKKIDKYPRYISVKNFSKTKIKEIEDLNRLNETILHVIEK